MNIELIGELIMFEKKNPSTNLKPDTTRKWEDMGLYEVVTNPRQEAGYEVSAPVQARRQRIPNSSEVLANSKRHISAHESPLKEWWKDEQSKKNKQD